ncbi:MAG TPA: carbohydrate porin [Mucilaginibacter sp.]|nr:carbohydrate porin [Mucilaginibacter sp.]
MKKLILSTLLSVFIYALANAQDSVKTQRTNFHFQQTIITQYKPPFDAPYTGKNSLLPTTETQSSITSTLYGGARLWHGAEAYFNPEISGGSGLSQTLGVAGFPNGETFRVGGVQNKIYIGRLYLKQTFGWGKEKDTLEDDLNQLAGIRSKRYFSLAVGKFGMADFFDNNQFSHDPREQFMNWALMDNAAWDYPANTRGYVMGLFAEYGQPDWTLRFAFAMVTTMPNQSVWDSKIGQANSQTVEFEKRYTINGLKGTLRILTFLNNGKFGNYAEATRQNPAAPNVDSTWVYGRHKYGFGINADQYLTKDFGVFAKASWNDGHTETWFFTEIDRSFTFGGTLKGTLWKRPDDEMGLGFILNGLSQDHKNYLAAGGYGFIIGDGQLNYSPEMIAEWYYKINVYEKKFWLSPDYQFILHPAYNADRGPVSVFGVRAHVEF